MSLTFNYTFFKKYLPFTNVQMMVNIVVKKKFHLQNCEKYNIYQHKLFCHKEEEIGIVISSWFYTKKKKGTHTQYLHKHKIFYYYFDQKNNKLLLYDG